MEQKKKSFKLSWLLPAAMLMMVLLSACGSNAENGNTAANQTNPSAEQTNSSANTKAEETAPAVEATKYPLTLTDASGTDVTFEAAPQRVVTLVPSETEIMYAIGAGDQVVGVDDNSNYPEDVATKAKVGGMEANIEAIVGLKPDLVLASTSMSAGVVEKLRGLNIKVYATDPKSYDAVTEKIATVGTIMDQAAEAAQVVKQMLDVKQQIQEAIAAKSERPKVYLEFAPGWTVGKGEFLDEIITLAGGVNVADQPGWYEIDPEKVIAANPDVIIYASLQVKEGEKNPILAAIETRPGWTAIAAIKNKQLYEVAQDPLVRVGPRLADGLLDVAKKLHPDAVK